MAVAIAAEPKIKRRMRKRVESAPVAPPASAESMPVVQLEQPAAPQVSEKTSEKLTPGQLVHLKDGVQLFGLTPIALQAYVLLDLRIRALYEARCRRWHWRLWRFVTRRLVPPSGLMLQEHAKMRGLGCGLLVAAGLPYHVPLGYNAERAGLLVAGPAPKEVGDAAAG